MTSDPTPDPGPVEDPWRGDVADGVAAWTRGRVVEAPSEGRSARRRSGRGGNRGPGGRRARQEPPPPELEPDADPESVARTILLDQLTGRARSRQELRDKLASRQVPDEVAETLLDRFEEVGLVDDDAFARAWVAGRQSAKGLARRAIASELRRKGVDDEVARAALDEIDPDDEDAAARALVRKKLRTLTRVDRATATRRLVAMLARKGYSPGAAYTVVREELADRDDGADDGADGGPSDDDQEPAYSDGP